MGVHPYSKKLPLHLSIQSKQLTEFYTDIRRIGSDRSRYSTTNKSSSKSSTINLLESASRIIISPLIEYTDYQYVNRLPSAANMQAEYIDSRIDEINDLNSPSLPLDMSITGILNSSVVSKMARGHLN